MLEMVVIIAWNNILHLLFRSFLRFVRSVSLVLECSPACFSTFLFILIRTHTHNSFFPNCKFNNQQTLLKSAEKCREKHKTNEYTKNNIKWAKKLNMYGAVLFWVCKREKGRKTTKTHRNRCYFAFPFRFEYIRIQIKTYMRDPLHIQ